MDEEYKASLPRTDSRLRLDRYWLEKGNMELAAKEKHLLEEKQRNERKEREQKSLEWHPKYWKRIENGELKWGWEYVRIQDYWGEKGQQKEHKM
jgi:hypothetical protein